MFRWLILFQEILKKRDVGSVIAHKDHSVNSLSLPCLETPCFVLQERKASAVFMVMYLASSGFVVPRNKCAPCLWVGPSWSSPALTTLPEPPARKPLLHLPQRHRVKFYEIEKVAFCHLERRGTSYFLPLSLGQNRSGLLGLAVGFMGY